MELLTTCLGQINNRNGRWGWEKGIQEVVKSIATTQFRMEDVYICELWGKLFHKRKMNEMKCEGPFNPFFPQVMLA